ncbi:MAG TPA: hypothetical protein VFZ14_05425, partial [Burkholderiales bacterium]|nr:hypothetical protein [Burkholderiales bacterium]
DGIAHLNAYLDDHAFLLDALLELLASGFRPVDLEFARALAERLLEQFEDAEHGGFFFVSHDHEALIMRPKSGHDNAMPSGNGVAAYALQRLGHLVGEPHYLEAAERALKHFYPQLARQPSGFPSLASALDEYLHAPKIVLLRGPAGEATRWQAALEVSYRPRVLIIALPENLHDLPSALDKPVSRAPAAWICERSQCLPPLAALSEVTRTLDTR